RDPCRLSSLPGTDGGASDNATRSNPNNLVCTHEATCAVDTRARPTGFCRLVLGVVEAVLGAADQHRMSHRRPDLPQLRKELELERLGEGGNAAGAARPRLVADDALHRLQVMGSPQLEVVVQVNQPLGE